MPAMRLLTEQMHAMQLKPALQILMPRLGGSRATRRAPPALQPAHRS